MRRVQPISVEASESQPRSKFATLESFVASEANRLALVSAQMVVRQPGQLSPLIFYGPTSVGKTHLLEGIWSAARKSSHRLTPVYLSAEQFTSYFLEALRGSGLPSFRRKYRSVGLLILDDLQFLVGKRATQVELLHTVDTFLREGRQLVFAADRSPADLAELGPELTTRLTGGMVCRIETPDHATRLGIIAQMAQRMQIQVPPDVQQYVASRLTNHPRELSGALCRLRATSHVSGRPICLSMAEEALADLNAQQCSRDPSARYRKSRLRDLWARSGQPAIRGQRKTRQPSADAGDVAGGSTPRRAQRNRLVFRPPQPQHGGFRAKTGRRLDGQWSSGRTGRPQLARRQCHPPSRAVSGGRLMYPAHSVCRSFPGRHTECAGYSRFYFELSASTDRSRQL